MIYKINKINKYLNLKNKTHKIKFYVLWNG